MPMENLGYDPVARFEEINGDVHQHTSGIAGKLDDDYTFVGVVGGGVYLCKVVDHDDAFWKITAEVGKGLTGSWDSESDKLAKKLDEDEAIVDDLGSHGRFLVYE